MKEKTVLNGTWWFPMALIPTKTDAKHTYFESNCGSKLARSLLQSDGRTAALSNYVLPMAIIRSNWSGTRIISNNSEADRELSTGSLTSTNRSKNAHYAKRLWVLSQKILSLRHNPFFLISNASVFLQRNGNNYCHFLTEVLPSVLVWLDEVNAFHNPHVVLPHSTFASPLLRLLGFKGIVSLVPFPSVIVARNVCVFRQFPAGYLSPELLGALSQRIVDAIGDFSCTGSEIVFLSRGPLEKRKLINEDEAIREIRKRFPSCEIVYPGQLSVEDQIARVSGARIVIAPHGAQAANMIWARNIEHFIEIGFDSSPNRIFEGLATALGASYSLVSSSALDGSDHYSDHKCDIGHLKWALSQI